MKDNYILIENIKGNKDLHEIAKRINFEDGQNYLPKNTTRKQFIEEIFAEINWQLEVSNAPTSKNELMEAMKQMIEIDNKEKSKKERGR